LCLPLAAVLNWRNLSENFAENFGVVASSGKSAVKAFSITFGFATNKIIPDDSLEEGTIYILNSVLKTTSTLPKAPMLSAD
jgi:hypothetical protein